MRVVSAPGKVLITGAYLVLEQPHPGLVLSTSARFYAIVKPILEDLPEDSKFWSWADVKVFSPQLDKVTSYKLSLRTCRLQISSTRTNFVEDAVQYAVATALAIADEQGVAGGRNAVYQHLLHGLDITILGSNDFYSFRKQIEAKGLPLTSASFASLPTFSPISLNKSYDSSTVPEVAKTGLGSSAAMTTAVVAGILEYLGIVQLTSQSSDVHGKSLDVVHATSQAAHCRAQGKIGSGFDVSAAVYGSQRYVRFSPAVLDPAMDPIDDKAKPLSLEKAMKPVLNKRNWDCITAKFALSRLLVLILGEPGHGGSHTPSMVGAVNAWRKRNPDAERCWKELAKANESVEEDLLHLKYLHDQHPENYLTAMEACSSCPADKWSDLGRYTEIVSSLLKLQQDFKNVRSLLRYMGEQAGVPIEPPSQTGLLDATMALPGVLFAGVPGAGGYDAVFAVTIGEKARSQVEKKWSERGVLTLTVHEAPRGVCVEDGDPRDATGVCVEDDDPRNATGVLQNQLASVELK